MTTSFHAPNELLPNQQDLCIILQGLCIHGGILKTKGQIYGEDMLLNNEALRRPFATLAMTYLHMLVLGRPLLNDLVLKYPEAAIPIRRSYVVYAVTRGILYKAELYRRREQSRFKKKKNAEIAAFDRGRLHKPKGDAEDVVGDAPSSRRVSLPTAFDSEGPDSEDALFDTTTTHVN